jgi:type III pantothenate kinase
MDSTPNTYGVAIVVGNTHLRWAKFHRQGLGAVAVTPIHTPNFCANFASELGNPALVAIASVVPHWTTLLCQQLHNFPLHILSLNDIPLQGMYPTLGIDRAIGAWQAGQMYGTGVLVIDGGTAISLTAIDQHFTLVGGAILPGRAMQLASLHRHTANLPHLQVSANFPPLWGKDTSTSIHSGVTYGTIGAVGKFLEMWSGQVVFTGGDGQFLHQALGRGDYVPDLLLLGVHHLCLPLLL